MQRQVVGGRPGGEGGREKGWAVGGEDTLAVGGNEAGERGGPRRPH